jgi:predicted DNA-binding transcriptional regulator YafY
MQVGSLEWMASVLAGLGCGFEIHSPDELRQHVRELARRLADLARQPRPSRARRRVSRP